MERILYCNYKDNTIGSIKIYKKWINQISLKYDGFYLFFTYEFNSFFVNIQPVYFEKENFADIIKYEVSIRNINKLLVQVKFYDLLIIKENDLDKNVDLLDKINNEISKYCFACKNDNIISEKMICWNQKHLKDINNVNKYFSEITYNSKITNNLKIIQNKINDYNKSKNNCFDKVIFRILNVGQANCSILKVNNENKVLFYIGNNRKQQNISLYDDLEKMHCLEYIVISHFHYDHINYYLNLPEICFNNALWFIPEKPLERGPICMENLYKKLMMKCPKIFVINNSNYFYKTKFFIILKGNGKKCTLNHLNDNSLVCYLNYKNDLLIPGDATYEHILLLKQIKTVDYLIIPHHGCKYFNNIDIKVNKLAYSPNDSGKKGTISYKYRHPQLNHINQITSKIIRFGKKVYYFDGKIRINDLKSLKNYGEFIDIDLIN